MATIAAVPPPPTPIYAITLTVVREVARVMTATMRDERDVIVVRQVARTFRVGS